MYVNENETYPTTSLVIPQFHVEHLFRHRFDIFFRITGGHGSKDQDSFADGGYNLLFYRH